MFVNERPYDLFAAKNIDFENYSAYNYSEITYEYNYYFKKYQDRTSNTGVPLSQIPNYYQLMSYYLGFSSEMNPEIVNSINY